MSLLTGLESFWQTTEADVLATIATIKADVAVVEADIVKAVGWVNANIPTINTYISEVNGALQTVAASGIVTIPPSVNTAIEIANKSVAALNAYQIDVAAGKSATTALMDGYSAIKQAQSSTALATLAIVQMPNAVPAPAPAPTA